MQTNWDYRPATGVRRARFCGRDSYRITGYLARVFRHIGERLLAEQKCTLVCLQSREPYCDCRCHGRYHGGYATTQILR
jgi:hypothetical protein